MKKKTAAPRRRKAKTASRTSSSSYEISGIIIFLFGVFALISLFSDGTGTVGKMVSDGIHFLFGVGSLFCALFLIVFGGRYALLSRGIAISRRNVLLGGLFVIFLTFVHHYYVPMGREMDISEILHYGGIVGGGLTALFHGALGEIGTTILLLGLLVIDILLLTHWSLSAGAEKVGSRAQTISKKTGERLGDVAQKIRDKKAAMDAARSAARLEVLDDKPTEFIFKKKEEEPAEEPVEESEEVPEKPEEPEQPVEEPTVDGLVAEPEETPAEESAPEEMEEVPPMPPLPEEEEPAGEGTPASKPEEEEPAMPEATEEEPTPAPTPEPVPAPEPAAEATSTAAPAPRAPITAIVKPEYKFPPLSLLHTDGGAGASHNDVAKNAALIESTLRSFGVMAKVIHASVGPTVTRFELRPEVGVRVSKIEGLSNELAMALAATHIRIEAPIPGKSAVGIEIPNAKSVAVPLRDVLDSDEFKHGKGHILVALGKDITGKPVVTDLAKMPHLLIAGSTGSGKSVCINCIITSIIYHSRPEDVKLMLIDPKVVELSVYNGIPHLRTEVITNMKKAEGALNWAVREMEARYQLFAGAKVRNIDGYNKMNPDKKMPYILIIVDEFADLMNVAAKDVEVLIQRLTQKARAAGIHLILATQRPSADVITGVIKSNIPSRIAFMVESALNSRIILDEGGAETLLGKGDMLFKQAGALTTVRIQGAFISDEEVEAVVDYVRNECLQQEKEPVKYEPIDLSVPDKEQPSQEEEEEQDDLLQEAAEWVLDTKRASVSALQRRFRIGYTRAGRLMDSMERMGIVGPAEGAKPREIKMTKDQARELFEGKDEAPAEEEKGPGDV
ncbi:DNA translocase FtsK [uncultured Dialister sp.]|jgi:S-DNA-T family DNA segregation ATPase FtsK/SpoIIIE|uniref:FtsK/SpoIIIE family DNA translocase n=1 Tax=uncultured Dialister sp. TaxID=278064 RepID=UPI0025D12811|nr:DNA translocase FtsK [uncultured Dialister sp.]